MRQTTRLSGAHILFLVTLFLVGTASHAEAPRHRFATFEQAVQAVDGILRATSPRGMEESSEASGEKTVANGLVLAGTSSYNRTGATVVINQDRIDNNSTTRTTGTLRLELWAVATDPGRGNGFSGFRLAVSQTFSPLAPRTSYTSIVRTQSFTDPAPGTYFIVLVLSEFSSTGCSQADGYCITDSLTFPTQQTFGGGGGGGGSGPVSIVNASVGLCVENYPFAAFQLLQQAQPGVWTSSTLSCPALGYPFFAGNFASDPSLRAYASSAAGATAVCATGLIINCTNPGTPNANYTDMWYNAAESGWGVAFIQHTSGIAFVTWYWYDNAGQAHWYVASSCRVVGSSCTDTLYETTGPPNGSFFDPARVVVRAVGSVTFNFTSNNTGTMRYTLNGVTVTKNITRQSF